jgi:RNA polymerase subunit RPABC4/transcription elongation factor Spt4
MYTEFEAKRVEKAQAMIGNRPIKADHFCKFLVDRTQFCPHKLLDSTTSYWLETITLLDGDHGVTLPATMDQIPIVFFDALSVVRSSRALARKEDKRD